MIIFVIGVTAFLLIVGGACYIVGHVAYKEGVEDEQRGRYFHADQYGYTEEDFIL